MTFTSSAPESEKQDSEFGIQARGNWKLETGNWKLGTRSLGQFPFSSFYLLPRPVFNF
jgi:hypothetical protein